VTLFGALCIRTTGKPRCATLHACPRYVRSIGKSSFLAFHFEILIESMMSACEAQASICDSRRRHDQWHRFVFPQVSRENAMKETRENYVFHFFLYLLLFFLVSRASFCAPCPIIIRVSCFYTWFSDSCLASRARSVWHSPVGNVISRKSRMKR